MATAGETELSVSSSTKNETDNNDGLLLYQYSMSFYCQKVVFALHEKKLKFKSRVIDLSQGEQLEPWFLKLNPKGEVPVLKDGVKVIPDSQRIIDYIEDNFSNGSTPRLTPEKGSAEYQTMERLRDLLDTIPVQLITYGCIFNPQLTGQMRLLPQEAKTRAAAFSAQENLLVDLCEKNPDYKEFYLSKRTAVEKKISIFKNPTEVGKGISDLSYALNEVERELASHTQDKKNWWLCYEKFTIADISLCVLLHRCHNLGLTDKLFGESGLPNLQEYFRKAQQRESFHKTMSQGSGIIKSLKSFASLDSSDQMFTAIGGFAAVLCAAGIAAFLITKNK